MARHPRTCVRGSFLLVIDPRKENLSTEGRPLKIVDGGRWWGSRFEVRKVRPSGVERDHRVTRGTATGSGACPLPLQIRQAQVPAGT